MYTYKRRNYRNLIYSDLEKFEVEYYESNLLICAKKNLKPLAYKWLIYFHKQIQNYIQKNPDFEKTLNPLKIKKNAPPIVKAMGKASAYADIGPMAAVAGAIAEYVGKKLLRYSDEIIVENGGDIFIAIKKKRKIGIFTGLNSVYNHLALLISPRDTPCGICTSSGVIGHSLSFGNTQATTIIAKSAILADGYATAVGNIVKEEEDIPLAIKFAKQKKDIRGLVIITREHLAAYGNIRFDILDK